MARRPLPACPGPGQQSNRRREDRRSGQGKRRSRRPETSPPSRQQPAAPGASFRPRRGRPRSRAVHSCQPASRRRPRSRAPARSVRSRELERAPPPTAPAMAAGRDAPACLRCPEAVRWPCRPSARGVEVVMISIIGLPRRDVNLLTDSHSGRRSVPSRVLVPGASRSSPCRAPGAATRTAS